MDDKRGSSDPAPTSGPTKSRQRAGGVKVAKAVGLLGVIVVGTVLPLSGVGLPAVDLPSIDLPSVGDLRDVDLPGWADRFFKILKPVKNAIIALLVLAAVFGEYGRRRKAEAGNKPTRAGTDRDCDHVTGPGNDSASDQGPTQAPDPDATDPATNPDGGERSQ